MEIDVMLVLARRIALTLTLATVVVRSAAAQEDSVKLQRLEAQVEAITRELEALRVGTEMMADADTGSYGFGPAASKVYKVRQGVSIGGYGEFLYENFSGSRQDDTPSGATDRIDALRAIVYVGYRFSDKILFNSEIEFEHGSTEDNGSVSLEFGYLDYRFSPRFGVRAGLLLAPMGFLNELHEPPTFLGARRPESERQIIPSTWRENGLGVFGEAGPLTYRAYLVNGFRGAGFSEGGLRGGRQNGSEASARHFGAVGRLEYAVTPGFLFAGSAYYGNSGQSDTVAAGTLIWEGHAEFRRGGFEIRGLVTGATLDDVAALNAEAGLAGNASIGERLMGWYLQAGYDVLRATTSSHQLIPYVRYEQLNTQDRVPAGFTSNPANDRTITTIGLAWKPLPNVSLKTDYQVQHNEARTGVNQINASLGYLF
jgi:hypothetical protein